MHNGKFIPCQTAASRTYHLPPKHTKTVHKTYVVTVQVWPPSTSTEVEDCKHSATRN